MDFYKDFYKGNGRQLKQQQPLEKAQVGEILWALAFDWI